MGQNWMATLGQYSTTIYSQLQFA